MSSGPEEKSDLEVRRHLHHQQFGIALSGLLEGGPYSEGEIWGKFETVDVIFILRDEQCISGEVSSGHEFTVHTVAWNAILKFPNSV